MASACRQGVARMQPASVLDRLVTEHTNISRQAHAHAYPVTGTGTGTHSRTRTLTAYACTHRPLAASARVRARARARAHLPHLRAHVARLPHLHAHVHARTYCTHTSHLHPRNERGRKRYFDQYKGTGTIAEQRARVRLRMIDALQQVVPKQCPGTTLAKSSRPAPDD